MRYANVIPFVTMAARTTAGQSNSLNHLEYKQGQVFLNVTAGSGTLQVTLQTSPDQVVWYDYVSFTAATGATKEVKSIENVGMYQRVVWTISEGGSFTFSVTGVLKS